MNQNRGLRHWRQVTERPNARQAKLLPTTEATPPTAGRALRRNPTAPRLQKPGSWSIAAALENPLLAARRLAQANNAQAIHTLIRVMLLGVRLPGFNPPTQIHGLIPRYRELLQQSPHDLLLVCCFQEQQDMLRQLMRIFIEAGGSADPLFFKTVEEWIEKEVPNSAAKS